MPTTDLDVQVRRFPLPGHIVSVREDHAIAEAQRLADANGAPCGVWERDRWFTICEIPPKDLDPDPSLSGWRLWAIVEPEGCEPCCCS